MEKRAYYILREVSYHERRRIKEAFQMDGPAAFDHIVNGGCWRFTRGDASRILTIWRTTAETALTWYEHYGYLV